MRETETETERNTAQELLDGLREMEEEAPGVGLCTLPFKLLIGKAEEIIAERDKLAAYRQATPVKKHGNTIGYCPRCGIAVNSVVDDFCGNCGQAISWEANLPWH